MIFRESDPDLRILNVMEYISSKTCQKGVAFDYSALSLRLASDARISWGEKSVSLSEGAVTYFPPHTRYTRACTVDRLIVIHFDISNFKGRDICAVYPKDRAGCLEDFKALLEIWTQKKPGYRLAAHALFYKIFEKLYLEFSDAAADTPRAIRSAVDRIHERYADKELTVASLAECCGLSEVYFRKLFKEHFGISPKKYITDLRMENARALLRSGEITVEEAAARSGFDNAKNFSTAFKKAVGYPPSKCRARRNYPI